MSNLYNQNIGQNYRGILNLDATTINTPLNATLRAVTDGTGTSSVLNLSTTQVNIGGGSALGRLVVRGDGTNPIARFEDSSGTLVFSVNNTNIFAVRPLFLDQITGYSSSNISINANTITTSSSTITTGSFSTLSVVSSIGSATGNANYRPLSLAYTINNSGVQTGNATGLFLNATETALNGMSHNLIDLQKNSISLFRINNDGSIFNQGNIICNGGLELNATGVVNFKSRASIYSSADSIIRMSNGAQTDFNRLQLGGTTSSFPSIKRNGSTIDFRLADDSAGCAISASSVFGTNLQFSGIIQDSNNGTNIDFPSNGVIALFNNGSTDFGRLQFGGTTSSFPSIKRNGAIIDFRLADDSNYCGINPLFVNVSSVGYYDFGAGNIRLSAVSTYSSIFSNWDGITLQTSWAVTAGTVGSENRMFIGASGDASAKLSVTSTTKGFLPPRQTTTQINAIVSPAEGLQIYNTTINHMCFYMNGAWVKINHSPM